MPILLSFIGLKLKLERDSSTLLQSFTYALFPTMVASSPVNWLYLASQDVQAENIRIHWLQKGDSLVELLVEFKENYASAVVLVNIHDNYDLDDNFVFGVKAVPIPTLIVTKRDGQKISDYVDQYDMIYAKVDAESQVDKYTIHGKVESAVIEKKTADSGLCMYVHSELRTL